MAETIRQLITALPTFTRPNNRSGRNYSLASLLALLGVALTLVPIIPGLLWVLWPALDITVWHSLLTDNQFTSAVSTTLSSAVGSTLLALIAASLIAMQHNLFKLLGGFRDWMQAQTSVATAKNHLASQLTLVPYVRRKG